MVVLGWITVTQFLICWPIGFCLGGMMTCVYYHFATTRGSFYSYIFALATALFTVWVMTQALPIG